MVVTRNIARIELTISNHSKEQNKMYFQKLWRRKTEIEAAFGEALVWEELPDNIMSRIKTEISQVNLFDESDWEQMNQFFIENLPIFEKAFSPYVKVLR